MVLAVDPEVPHDPAPATLGVVWESLENSVLDNHPWIREPLWKSRSPAEKFQHTTGAKEIEIGHNGEGKRNSLTLSASHLL